MDAQVRKAVAEWDDDARKMLTDMLQFVRAERDKQQYRVVGFKRQANRTELITLANYMSVALTAEARVERCEQTYQEIRRWALTNIDGSVPLSDVLREHRLALLEYLASARTWAGQGQDAIPKTEAIADHLSWLKHLIRWAADFRA